MTYRVFTAPTPRSTLGAMLLWLGCIAALLSSSLTFGATPAALAKPAMAQAMVVTANPHATRAGEWVLQQGGSAVDAAVAIEATLSLVEPQSSGLGGWRVLGLPRRRQWRSIGLRWSGDRPRRRITLPLSYRRRRAFAVFWRQKIAVSRLVSPGLLHC